MQSFDEHDVFKTCEADPFGCSRCWHVAGSGLIALDASGVFMAACFQQWQHPSDVSGSSGSMVSRAMCTEMATGIEIVGKIFEI